MRRTGALALFTLGYVLMALLDATVSAGPALASFAGGAALLLRPPEAETQVERIARELSRR